MYCIATIYIFSLYSPSAHPGGGPEGGASVLHLHPGELGSSRPAQRTNSGLSAAVGGAAVGEGAGTLIFIDTLGTDTWLRAIIPV